MKAPESLQALLDYGILDRVVRPLMSGKEAQVYVVEAGGQACVAKVYKEASQRNFKQRVEYTEGRRTRNSRDQRAINKRTKHGRRQDESAWRNTEVDMIHRLRDAGVRVPEPINYVDGVLVMELVQDAHGDPAPRLGDLEFNAAEAAEIHGRLVREVIRMLCAGVVHGDLSEFNVLMGADGPVVIDFPQAVDPASNQNAGKLLLRDVENLDRFLARFSPGRTLKRLGPEIWSLFEANRLEPETELTGRYTAPEGKANTDEVLALIEDAARDERRRRGHDDLDEDDADEPVPAIRPRRVFVDFSNERRPNERRAKPPKQAASGAAGRKPAAASQRSSDAGSQRSTESPSQRSTESPSQRSTESPQRRPAKGHGRPSGRAPEPSPQARGEAAEGGRPARKRGRRRRSRGGSGATGPSSPSPAGAAHTHGPSKPSRPEPGEARPAPDAGADARPPRARRRRRRRPTATGPRE